MKVKLSSNLTFSKKWILKFSQIQLFFSKTIATIATQLDNQLVFSYLSVAIRAFPIATYCHLLPHSGEKRGILSEKAEEYLLFSQKNIKKVKKKTCGFEHFLYFCNQQEKFLPIPPRSLRLL